MLSNGYFWGKDLEPGDLDLEGYLLLIVYHVNI
jgi:hypothetical protein